MEAIKLPFGWKITTLGELAHQNGYGLVDGPFGSSLPSSDYIPFGIPVIRGSNLSLGTVRFENEAFVYVSKETAKRLERSLCQSRDIIFTKKGTLGQVGIIPAQSRFSCYLISSNQMKLSVDKQIADPLYIYYFFASPASREKIIRDSEVTGVPKTNLTYLRKFPVILPPLPEQQGIAHILGSLDDKIELNRQMNETLEDMARALFKSWFVDFDPVRAKMEGRLPYGMDAETAELFPDGFEDSRLGKIPEEWKVVSLPEAIEVNPFRSLHHDHIAPYLEMSNISNTSARVLKWESRAFSSGTKFMNGDTLVARITPCLENGKTAFVDFLAENEVGWGSTEYIIFRSCSSLPVEYSYFLARSDNFREYAIRNMTGTSGRQRVPTSCFNSYLIVKPSQECTTIFGSIAKSFMRAIKQKDEETQTLSTIRDTLLPKLLSGEIRVRDAEKEVEAAL